MRGLLRLGRWIVGESNLDQIERANLLEVEVSIKDNEIYLCRRLGAKVLKLIGQMTFPATTKIVMIVRVAR